jgi:methionine-rich copper-binding protein CopC
MQLVSKIVNLPLLVPLMLMAWINPGSTQSEPKFTFPTADSTVAGDIGVIRVGFDETIDPALSGLELRNGEGQVSADGAGYGNCETLSCHLYLGQLKPDVYTVTYNVFTPSGKVMKSQFTFSVGGSN